jgi:membrane fusion protein (multidrug efflux system)
MKACMASRNIQSVGSTGGSNDRYDEGRSVFPEPGSYLRPGQFARLRVAVAEKENAILVPQRAIQEMQGAKTVMVVDAKNTVSVRTVRLGDKSDKDVIVLEGLTPESA